eukprot:6210452-Pleurochrysis_carterae.AAC.1
MHAQRMYSQSHTYTKAYRDRQRRTDDGRMGGRGAAGGLERGVQMSKQATANRSKLARNEMKSNAWDEERGPRASAGMRELGRRSAKGYDGVTMASFGRSRSPESRAGAGGRSAQPHARTLQEKSEFTSTLFSLLQERLLRKHTRSHTHVKIGCSESSRPCCLSAQRGGKDWCKQWWWEKRY